MCRSVAYLRRASAKEPPIRPVPRMVVREIRCGDMSELTVDSLQSKAGKKITHPSSQGKETRRARRFAGKHSQEWLCHANRTLRHAAADGWGDDAELGHELGEGGGLQGLSAVREGVVGVVVDFDQQAVGAGGYRGAGHGGNFVAAAGAVGRVGQHWEVRQLFDYGDGGDVEGVAGVGLKGADAALAEDYVVVAAGEDVFGAEEEFFHGGGHAALEENRFADFA